MDLHLGGQTAVIVGGARGIGLAIGREFAAEGANVALLDRDGEVNRAATTIADDFRVQTEPACVDVTDFSPVQLDLHRAHVGGTSAESAVLSRDLLDICDTSRYPDGEFDVVVAYGGPLSYAFEDAGEALNGLLRIVRPGGFVVASVMSLWGTWRYQLCGVMADALVVGEDANDLVITTGDLRHSAVGHVCQMFRSTDVANLVSPDVGVVVAMSASNWASLADEEIFEQVSADPDRWQRFLKHEVAACAAPGAVDGGTHLMFAVQRPRR